MRTILCVSRKKNNIHNIFITDSKKSRLTEEDLKFRHIPKRRCPTLDDEHDFEKRSLHRTLHIREKEELNKPKRSKTTLTFGYTTANTNTTKYPTPAVTPSAAPAATVIPTTTTKPFTFRTELLRENRRQQELHKKRIASILRSKSQDDMRLFLQSDEQNHTKLLQTCFPSKRTRSVPITNSIDASEIQNNQKTPSFRRMVYYARKYDTPDDVIHNEEEEEVVEDEGYGSKTPSNDEKDITNLFSEALNIEGSSYSQNGSVKSNPKNGKLAKFSYTHQVAKSQLYEESEDDRSTRVDTSRSDSSIKYYKTGYVDTRDGEFVKRMLNRAYSTVGTEFESTSIYRLEGVKPPVSMRRISIQDSANDPCAAYATHSRNGATGYEKTEMYDHQKTVVRHSMYAQSDRTQYPVFCATPELKFNTSPSPQSRPSSKASVRGTNVKPGSAKRVPSGSPRVTQSKSNSIAKPHESVRRTKSNCSELYRSHTNVCMPIGDLLPAVDKSINNKYKSRQSMSVSQSVPELPTSVLTPRVMEDPQTLSTEYHILPGSKVNPSTEYHIIHGSKVNPSTEYHIIHGSKVNPSTEYHIIHGSKVNLSTEYHILPGSKVNPSTEYHIIHGSKVNPSTEYHILPGSKGKPQH